MSIGLQLVAASFMGFIIFPALAVVLTVGYTYRDSLTLWGFLIQLEPQKDLWTILLENYLFWLGTYTLAYLIFYLEPTKTLFMPFKFNNDVPPLSLQVTEFMRSFRGIFIGSIMEVATFTYLSNRDRESIYPLVSLDIFKVTDLMYEQGANQLSLTTVIIGAAILYLWGDFHFYWTHRLLHINFLYGSVHKFHHESKNPTPWAGLSMHWFESAVYFSSAPIGAMLIAPPWLVRALFKGLILFPLEGHIGFGSWSVESSHNHYLHHAKFNFNYGSSPLWDHIMGTTIKPEAPQKKGK